MKKTFIQISVFLILIIGFIIGLTYISLDRNTKEEGQKTQEDVMSIALVNEDEGTVYNERMFDFGEAFVKSVALNEDHEWYVVSRGVAESGLSRNTYDMMIVIPNDFSKKALSIDSLSPQPVVLNYKINASDSEIVRAEAEKTANSILNDFNKNIIDVYFASVIGNLNEAQDNVAELVQDYASLTYSYNNGVQEPLSGYTGQFGTIKDSAANSLNAFQTFEKKLDNYETTLVDQIGSFEDHRTSIEEAVETNQSLFTSMITTEVNQQMNDYLSEMQLGAAEKQLDTLEALNQYIDAQLQANSSNVADDIEEELDEIALHTEAISSRLNQALQLVEDAEGNFNSVSIDEQLREDISSFFRDAFAEQKDMTVLLEQQQKQFEENIEAQIRSLPTLNENVFMDSDLSDATIQEISNVIRVTKKYNQEMNPVDVSNDTVILPEYLRLLKQKLNRDGVQLTDTVKLPKSNKPLREFAISEIPDGFEITRLSVHLPNGEEKVLQNYQANEKVILPEYQDGTFTIDLTLRLKDSHLDAPLDIHGMQQWKWQLYQVDEEELEATETENDPIVSTNLETNASPQVMTASFVANNQGEEQQEADELPETPTEEENIVEEEVPAEEREEETEKEDSSDEHQEETVDEEDHLDQPEEDNADETEENNENNREEENEDSREGNDDHEDEQEGNDDADEIEEEEEVEVVEINHHYIQHTVQSSVVDSETSDLIQTVENTIIPYQQLLSSFETYFGVDLSCQQGNCAQIGQESKLKDMATNDSLYVLFQKDMGELMVDHTVDQIMNQVTGEWNASVNQFESDVESYRQYVEDTAGKADELAETIVHTREVAGDVHENAQSILEDIELWRDESINDVDQQEEIPQIDVEDDEEQTVALSVNDGFRSLLTQSQLLADQASNNLQEADTVYRTFETVDEQADRITESGENIVLEAENLSSSMTDKLINDQAFADNFAGVMENSRIGERQNEDLYDFLANPVKTKNDGVIVQKHIFTAYFLVLISVITALFTAYVISILNQQRHQVDQFEEERTLIGQNALVTGITAGIGLLEGLLIGFVSAQLLNIEGSKMFLWIGLMIIIMLALVLATTYLLRQIKMIGMFIILAITSMYLFLTNAISSSLSEGSMLRNYSPLQYIERLLNRVLQGSDDYGMIVISLVGIIVIFVFANLFVVTSKKQEQTEDDTDAA